MIGLFPTAVRTIRTCAFSKLGWWHSCTETYLVCKPAKDLVNWWFQRFCMFNPRDGIFDDDPFCCWSTRWSSSLQTAPRHMWASGRMAAWGLAGTRESSHDFGFFEVSDSGGFNGCITNDTWDNWVSLNMADSPEFMDISMYNGESDDNLSKFVDTVLYLRNHLYQEQNASQENSFASTNGTECMHEGSKAA